MDFIFIMLTLKIILLSCPENISCLQFRRAAIRACNHSLESVKEGLGCPRNKSEWEKRAQEMQCETYSQNCTDKSSFVYHCLINPWSNGTIEVCAPRIKIFGKKCTEFNIGGARVQTHYKKTCQSCPRRYYSSESYKYHECYKLVEIVELPMTQESSSNVFTSMTIKGKVQDIFNTTNQTSKTDFGYEKQKTLLAILIPMCAFSIIVLLFLFLKKENASGNKKSIEDRENGISNESDGEMAFTLKGENKEVQNPLEMKTDFLKCLCKIVDCEKGMDGLKEKIRHSPYYDKYAEYLTEKTSPVLSVTGNWREDIGIQAAADIFNIKIYVVHTHMQERKKTTIFLPKDIAAERWMKISVEKEFQYTYLSDCDTCNEEEAELWYDDLYELPDQDSKGQEDVFIC